MTPSRDLDAVRLAYARQVAHAARVEDPRIEAALAAIPREAFLGAGPWDLIRFPGGRQATPDADPVYLYQDTPVSLVADKSLNNGQPSFVAMLIGLCAVREGERIVHIGTGTGYYTAILARLAGPSGRVLGIEVEEALATRATANLTRRANTTIRCGDGWTLPLDPADVILVNAGTPRFAETWLGALAPGGRLVLPLAMSDRENGRPATRGAVFLITRDRDGYAASCASGVAIYPCEGASDAEAEAALAAALAAGGARKVTRLRREPVDAARCWLRGPGWSLTYD